MRVKMILTLSLCLNAGLILGFVVQRKSVKPLTTLSHEPPSTPALSAASFGASAPVPAPEIVKTVDWRAVESEDYRKYISNLRAIGCPEETIRDIITADVAKLFESRRKELVGPKKKFEFWKPGAIVGAAVDSERLEKERILSREKRDLLTDLLGTPPELKPDLLAGAATQLEAMFDFLPLEKQGKVSELLQDLQIKMQKAAQGGSPDPQEIRKLMKESELSLAAVLTPVEMMDYNLRFSMTANTMRMQMAGFEPNEQEFLEVFKLRKSFDDEFGGGFGAPASFGKEERARVEAAQKELDANIKNALGESRFEEYKRGQDYAYQGLDRLVEKEGLGKEAAVRAYEMKKIAEEQANKIRRDASMTTEQRRATLQAIRGETERSMRQVLGEKGFSSYQNQNHSYWLRAISPDPKP